MYFENFQYLYLLPLTTLPLIIYLIFRRKPKRMIFSSLFLLKDITQKANRRTRIKDIILLILRTLLLLILILIFASPFFGDRTGFDPSKRTVAVFFLDTGSSMADSFYGGTKVEYSRNILIKTISNLPDNSSVYILTSDPDSKFKGNIRDAVKFINSVEIYGKDRDLIEITGFADSIFVDSGENNNVLLAVTDGYLPFSEREGKEIEYFKKALILAKEDKSVDVSIDSVQVSERKYIYLNISSDAAGPAVLDLFLDGKKIHSREIAFDKANSVTAKIELTESGNAGGSLSAVVSDEKGNRLNDSYNFVIPEMSKKKMLIFGDEMKSNAVKSLKALIRTGGDSLFIPEIRDPGSAGSVRFSDYSLILFLEMSHLNPFTVSGLKNYISEGGGVYFFASEKLNLSDYNSNLIGTLGFSDISGYEKKEDSYAGINITKIDHPIFRNVFSEDFTKVSSAEIYNYYKLAPKTGWESIVKSGKDPILLERNLRRGRIFFLTCGLEKNNSNILGNGISVPLLLNSFLYLAGTEQEGSDPKTIGDVIESDEYFYLVKPGMNFDRNTEELSKKFRIKKPGFYKMYRETGAYLKSFAVNYEREDYSDNSTAIQKHFKAISISNSSESDAELISFGNRDLKIYFLIALLFVLCAEILIVRFMK